MRPLPEVIDVLCDAGGKFAIKHYEADDDCHEFYNAQAIGITWEKMMEILPKCRGRHMEMIHSGEPDGTCRIIVYSHDVEDFPEWSDMLRRLGNKK